VTLAHAIANQPPPNLRDAWPDAPASAADLLVRAMARDPAQRPRSAGELVARLRAALAPRPADPPRRRNIAAARPDGRTPRRAAALVAIVAAAIVAAIIVLVVLLNSSGSGPPARTQAAGGGHHTAATGRARRPGTTSRSATSTTTPAAPSSASSSPTTTSPAPASSSASTPSATSPTAPAVSAPASAGSPAGAVEAFYGAAAAHRYASAWALADPTLRAQLQGYRSFQEGQAGDRSITFNSANVVSRSPSAATVAVQTTSVRDNGTQHCTGTVDLVAAGNGGPWRLHLIHINCT
jgi:hypothetical protein